jgi:hypothetical protein
MRFSIVTSSGGSSLPARERNSASAARGEVVAGHARAVDLSRPDSSARADLVGEVDRGHRSRSGGGRRRAAAHVQDEFSLA